MLRPLSLLPALVAVAATAVPAHSAVEDPGADRPAPVSRSQSRTVAPPAAPARDPLEVSIDALAPSYVPAKGSLRVSGSVTNTTDEEWRAINLHPFIGSSPITTSEELAEQVRLDPSQPVGDRITAAGAFDNLTGLDPGESAQFSIKLSRATLGVSAPGVYWFGVHALGETDQGRDATADGRARTFVPLVPRTRRSVDTALVIPIRHEVRRLENGRLAGVHGWARSLDTGGALRSLVDFGASAGSRPLTWLVDPAVPDAVGALVAGNPRRTLEDTVVPDAPGEDPETPTPEEESSSGASPSPAPDPAAAPENAATAPGTAWLNRFREALGDDEVLSLPYGDLDVSAAAERDPHVYGVARRRSGAQLQRWGVVTGPAVAAPSGYLDPAALGVLDRRATILVAEEMFADQAPPVARTDGRRLTAFSAATAEGGPGPGDRRAAIPMRQQILSEAALRLLNPGRRPLVVVFPQGWRPTGTSDFFAGLDVDWLNLTDLGPVTGRTGVRVDAEDLEYPDSQATDELDAANFASADALVQAGETLENVLTRNDVVADEVRDEALSGLSYASRSHADAARASADRSRQWIASRLGSIRVAAPRAVTLSSTSGRFSATVTNALDHTVTVRVEAVTEDEMTIEPADSVEVPPRGRTSVLLEATTDRLGVHRVELLVTDETGTPLGSSDELPIRSAQVSDVIWLIVGAGITLLFVAIAVRLVRRIRGARP